MDTSMDGVINPIIKKMLQRFDMSSEAESENRKRGLIALKFRVGGQNQWDDAMWKLRGENNQPRESYNQIPQFVHQVTNDMRMNLGETRIIPTGDGSKTVATVLEDLHRCIASSSEAEVAYDTAADSAVTIGWGYWRFITEYENDKTFDQVIKYRWVPNAFTVYDDPTSMAQDKLDRTYLLEVADVPVSDFNGEYDKNYDSERLKSIGDSAPEWTKNPSDPDKALIRIAEYWEVVKTKSKLYRHKTTKLVTTMVPEGYDTKDFETRDVETPKVIWRKCTAEEVLQEKEWPGSYIPYIYVSGEELNVDGKWQRSGLVEHMMSPQRQYNYWNNSATEIVGLMTMAPYILDPAQIEGVYQTIWDNANVKRYPFLPARRFIKDKDYGMPQRANNSADITAMSSLIQLAQQNFYVTTGIYPASLGKQGNETSGVAIGKREKQGDISTFHFPDNMSRAQRAGGRVYLDLAPKIYDGARVVRLLREDKTNVDMPINQPIQDTKTGQPMVIDLTVGTYDVAVSNGANYATKREEEQEALLQLAGSTNLMEVAPDIFYSKQDWSGADELAERYKKTLPPNLVGDDNGIPPQITAQLQQAQQVITQLGQKVQELTQENQSKQAENAIKMQELQIKQQEYSSDAQTDQMKAQNEAMKLKLDEQRNMLEAEKIQLARDELKLEFAKMQLGSMPQTSSGAVTAQMGMSPSAQGIDPETFMEGMKGIANTLAALTASMNAPKTIIRDPKTGLAQGVATVGA